MPWVSSIARTLFDVFCFTELSGRRIIMYFSSEGCDSVGGPSILWVSADGFSLVKVGLFRITLRIFSSLRGLLLRSAIFLFPDRNTVGLLSWFVLRFPPPRWLTFTSFLFQ